MLSQVCGGPAVGQWRGMGGESLAVRRLDWKRGVKGLTSELRAPAGAHLSGLDGGG